MLFIINPQMTLSIEEEKKKITLSALYNQSLTSGSLNEEKKKNFLSIWKAIIQPKTNKFKVLKIYLTSSVALPLVIILILSLVETLVLLCVMNSVDFSFLNGRLIVLKAFGNLFSILCSIQFSNLLRVIQEVLLVRICMNILKMFSAYKLFLNNSKRVTIISTLCYGLMLNMFVNIHSVSYYCPHALWAVVYCVVISIVMFIDMNINHTNPIIKLNHLLYKLIG